MENKEIRYYTPKIEDFHIGYQYEYWCDNEWNKEIIKTGQCFNFALFRLEDEKNVRTKHLDKSDIENLGWEYNKENNIYKICLCSDYEIFDYTLKHIEHQNAIHITLTYKSPKESIENETYFKGKCPSINELITIQRLLGIE
jgi:hypothetical protein